MTHFSTWLLVLTLSVTAALLALQPTRRDEIAKHPVVADRDVAAPAPVQFRDVALSLGIGAAHRQSAGKLTALTETIGGGVCVLDANGDDWPDLFFVGGSGNRRHYGDSSWWYRGQGNRLYLNEAAGTAFRDVTEAWGLSSEDWGMGCLAADLNGDQLPELLVYGLGANSLYVHQGQGQGYRKLTGIPALEKPHWTMGASIADVNRDGLADIYLSNYVRYLKGAHTFEPFSGFDVEAGAPFRARLYDAEPNQLLVNRGQLQFVEMAAELGVANAQGRSLGARWLRLDDDIWPDLLVLNDHGTPNAVLLNRRGRVFFPAPEALAPLAMPGSHDLTVLRGGAEPSRQFLFTRGAGFTNALIRQQPDGLADISRSAGLGRSDFLARVSWGVARGDFNLDTYPDLYVANGQVVPDPEAGHVPGGQPDDLLLGSGSGFVPAPGFTSHNPFVSSRGVASLDLDRDGRLDIVVTGNNSAPAVYRNLSETDNRWLAVRLEGPDSERIGAAVRLEASSGTQWRRAAYGEGFLSQSDREMLFGLADADSAIVTVYWPGGDISRHDIQAVDRVIVLGRAGKLRELEPAQPEPGPSVGISKITALGPMATIPVADTARRVGEKGLLKQLWRHGDVVTRRAILGDMEREDGTLAMEFLQASLRSQDSRLVHSGLQAAQRLEFERSVDWLAVLLESPDSQIVCETSSVLEYFFTQEEAAIRRKYLSVVPLVKNLDRTPVAACAARALGAAEKKRAVPALLALLETTEDARARAEAVRGLGLLRDTGALHILQQLSIAADVDELTLAHLFVARVRLGEPPADALRDLDQRPLRQRLDVLAVLYSEEDTAVIPRQHLDSSLATAVASGRANQDRETRRAAYRAMGLSKQSVYRDELLSLRDSRDRATALAAYAALAELGVGRDAFARLAERDREFVELLLAQKPAIHLGPDLLLALLQRGVSFESLQVPLQLLGAAGYSALFEQLAAAALPVPEQLLDNCLTALTVPLDSHFFLQLEPSLQLSDAALSCFLYRDNSPVDGRERIERRLTVKRAMAGLTAEQGQLLQQKLASFDEFYARDSLFGHLSQESFPYYLRYLMQKPPVEAALILQRLADDRGMDTINRARALQQLSQLNVAGAKISLQRMLQ